MVPRLNTGKGISGAVRYVLGQGRNAKTGELNPEAANENESRVDWISGTGFGFAINTAADAELARRIMEFDALNQTSRTRQCEQDCIHLSLGWKAGETPTRKEMEEAAEDALKALGMGNAKALFVAHRDEDHAHVHIVASKINPATGRAYDLAGSWRTLSKWAQAYELEHGGMLCTRREGANELRDAIADRDADRVLSAMTKQRATFTAGQLYRALEKEIIGPARGDARAAAEKELAGFHAEVLARPQLIELVDDGKATPAAAEPWMMERGGFDALNAEHKASAEQSYELWRTERNPEAGARHDLRDYVQYVQKQWAENNQQADQTARTVGRFTTRTVLDAEHQVTLAAAEMAADFSHGVSDQTREKVAAGKTMSDEQTAAFIHATLPGGFAIIDGQAGTGKSYTLAAVREAYEDSGCSVIGLAPTNKVAKAMKADGFSHAATIHAELFALNNGRRTWDAKTVVVVDEAAMLDTKLMAMVTSHAAAAGAKLILAGDDRQLSSIDYGGMFAVLKDRHGAAELTEVKRQHKNDERRASEMFASGNFHDALGIYEGKGAIHWTRTQTEARDELVDQWKADSAAEPGKTRFVFAYTNADVASLNAALRDVRKQRGELGDVEASFQTKHGRAAFATADRIQFTGTDKKLGIDNGAAGTIEAIRGREITVRLDGKKGEAVTFDAELFNKFRHGYAGTIYAGQGATLDQTYLYHSEHWRSASSYVAMTRHRDKAALFVARNTAKDVKQLARQMGRTDDRRAASMFQLAERQAQDEQQQHAAEIPRLLPPAELLAQLAPPAARQQAAEAAHEAELYRDDPPAAHRGERQAGHYDDMDAAHRAAEPEPPARRYDVLRDEAPPEIVRTFAAAAARATEPAAENFDRDAADAAWNDKVAAAGIEHGATPKKDAAATDAAAMPNPRPATMDDFYPSAGTDEATGPADAGDGTKPPGSSTPAADGPEIGAHGMSTVADAAETALEIGDRAAGKILGLFGRVAEALTGLLAFSFMGGPKYTRQQQRDAAQARGNLETRDARDYAAHVAQREAEHDDRIHAAKTTQQETDLRLAMTLGTPATAEADPNRDEHEATRELERKRGLSL